MVRNLSARDVAARCAEWTEFLSADTGDAQSPELNHLYQGEAWQQVTSLASSGSASGRARVLVASAGLGLQSVNARHPSYAATFSSGHQDTVARRSESALWWKGLDEAPQAQPMAEIRGRQALLVLSEPYARAMHDDLEALATAGADVLLVGGWRNIEGISRLPADRALRATLGGTTSSLLIRMAQRWLADWNGGSLHSEVRQREWDRWARDARQVDHFDRKRLSDNEVIEFASQQKRTYPGISASRALRSLRSSGYACEQARFSRLFRIAAAGDHDEQH